MFGGVDTCAEEQRLGSFVSWLFLFYFIEVKLRTLGLISMGVQFFWVLWLFAESWTIVGTNSSTMIEFSMRLGWVRWPAWYNNIFYNCYVARFPENRDLGLAGKFHELLSLIVVVMAQFSQKSLLNLEWRNWSSS